MSLVQLGIKINITKVMQPNTKPVSVN